MRSLANLPQAVSAATVVAVVGLSQLLAVGALSFTPLGHEALASGVVAAFVTATFGAFCVALVARTPGDIAGPRTSISVIYAALCADLVLRSSPNFSVAEILAALSLATVLMGLLQMLAGFMRLGDAMKFLPYPVNAGFVTGIGLAVVWSQIGPLLGMPGSFSHYHWMDVVENFKPLALLVGSLSAATVWLAPAFTPRVQPHLAGLVVGTGAYHLIAQFTEPGALGSTLGTITPFAAAVDNFTSSWGRVSLPWMLDTAVDVFPYAGFLALQATLNAAVSNSAVSDITGVRISLNRTLIAQGAGNLLCGALAALPIGSSQSQSLLAAKLPGNHAAVPALSAVVLLVAVLVFGEFVAHIPLAVLAGLLVTAGISTVDRWARNLFSRVIREHGASREVRWNLMIVVVVAATFVLGSVPLALLVGTILATILLAIDLHSETTFEARDGAQYPSSRIWPSEQARWLHEARSCVRVVRPRGGLFFGTADRLAGELDGIGAGIRYCVIDLSRLTALDASGCQLIGARAKRLAGRGIVVLLAGLDIRDPHDRALIDLGLAFPPPKNSWFRDLDYAIERVEAELLRERWPDVAQDAPVDFAKSPLAIGLSPAELATVYACTTVRDLPAGATLYERGAEASSICLIDHGLVEIRVNTGSDSRDWRRLAVLGPGCIIGEVAMLTRGTRSADAVCVTASRVLELRYDDLHALEREQPVVYGRILANLSVILAERLRSAIDITRQ